MTLAEKLRTIQGSRSQVAFARQLGIGQSALSQIYGGQRKVGIRVMRRVCALHPEAADELGLLFLAESITGRAVYSHVA